MRSSTLNGVRAVRASAGERPAGGHYEASIYLDNIAAAAYGQMVPITTIIPIHGAINGRTTVVARNGELECRGAFDMKKVRFAPNPALVTDPDDAEVVCRLLADVVYSGPFELCQSDVVDGTGAERPAAYAAVAPHGTATADASPGVKALADRNPRTIAGEAVETSLSTLTNSLAQQMGIRLATKVAGARGQAVAQPLAAGDSQSSGGRNSGQAVVAA